MKTIYYKYFEDGYSETDAFFDLDPKLVLITAWSCNDASYREEYMTSLFSYLDIKIESLPEKYNKKAKKLVNEAFGID